MIHDNDDLEPAAGASKHSSVAAPTALETKSHIITDHNQKLTEHYGQGQTGDEKFEYSEALLLLPGQILTETIARLRFTIVLVSFFYSGLFFVFGILAVALVAPNIMFALNQASPILLHTAKIIISLIAFGLGLVAVAIGLKHRDLTSKLALAEILIDRIRDTAMIQMESTRFTLEQLTERLRFPKDEHHASPFDYIELAKKIGPVITLLMAKERSVVTIAVEGLKLFQALKKVLKK